MIRRIIKIDEDKCNGCALCAEACHEGAIAMVDGKARLMRDDYCDGLGDCLPVCPTGAISFEEREALAYDEVAVQRNMAAQRLQMPQMPCGCPGSQVRSLEPGFGCPGSQMRALEQDSALPAEQPTSGPVAAQPMPSQLRQWPVQIKLAPVNAPFFQNANLLIAADCTAYAYGDFHSRFMRNKVTLIGCPKLDEGDYAEKLAAILRGNDINSLTVARMEVPCCGGIVQAVQRALQMSGKMIPWKIVTISVDGRVADES